MKNFSSHVSRGRRSVALCYLPLTLFAASVALAAPEEGRRVALLVGNDAYSIKPLQNAVNDVRAMNKALMSAGFRTIVRENANKAVMEQAAAEFLQAIGPGDTALFFYAGHAVQIENENVLIPVDFESSRTVIEARFRSFSLAMIFEYLKRSRAKTTIVIIDGCRSNPVAEGHALQAGLAQPGNAGKETYIAFSTSPNHVANDNPDGKNSWFTEALSDQITQEGLTLDEIFTRVRMQVEKATKGLQIPWSLTSLTTKFYFHPPKGALAQSDPSLVDQWLLEARTREQFGDWEEALNLFDRVLKQQPGGSAEEAARTRLPYVKARLDAATQFGSGHFNEAAQRYEEALRLDPLAVDAAEGAFRSYLLREDLGKAVSALQIVRQRGPSARAAKADLALKELAAVSTEAAEELKRGKPQPPPIQDLFPYTRFGVPDWGAVQRAFRQARPADLGKWAKQLPEPLARPSASATQVASAPGTSAQPVAANTGGAPAAADPAMLSHFHVEVRSFTTTRDLIREEFGELRMKSELPNTGVILDGKTVTRQLPHTMKVPAGKYVVRTVDSGQMVGSQEVEVKAGAVLELLIK